MKLSDAFEKVLPDLASAIQAAKSMSYKEFKAQASKWAPIIAHHGTTGLKEFWKKANRASIFILAYTLASQLLA